MLDCVKLASTHHLVFYSKQSKYRVRIASYFHLLDYIVKPISSDQVVKPGRSTSTITIGKKSLSNQPS